MSKKFYFQKHDEMCYHKDYHIQYMKDNDLKEMDVFEAKVDRGSGYFFCKEHYEIGEVGESCGKFCQQYKPLNGKSGRCTHYGNVYDQTDKVLKLKI